ncbi:HAD-IA family hydrolase [uncultured Piscinibacter sp.]|uniref:HAD-IA family hydrolase n=1 Tax=uncultured Piscinibacter sp. TaxID=1131835 RepID=UPI0026182B06|nr:HAD-IA family hydrolase [uncultured Piscinibacter sp.]
MNDDLRGIRAVAFDLDGTLVDSAPDIQHALNAALKKAGLQRFDLDLVRGWIGDGPDMLIARALAHQGLADADAELRARLRRWFDVDTLAAPLAAGSVFAGILELLSGLRRVLPMVAVTNKPTPLARAVLDAAGVLPFLEGVQGADRPELRKPAPAMLLSACERLGVAPQEMLMVGDSALDMQSAQAAGCRAVLVTWGYGHGTLPAWLDPLRIDAPDQLLQALLATRGPAVPILNS